MDREIVIKLPEDFIELAKTSPNYYPMFQFEKIWGAIKNGTPLPKEHGRLVDADVLADGMEDDYEFCEVVNATPTVIKARRGAEK